ncbi:GNAT family N-acetyltransferase [Salipaludibacillus sp. HK11]|uniref:GNAT family N-acetyltransferase n=1 Tax=Salipaludibacillus sp. HK11 TaxID=3394320 RepID=UPI0039FB93D1
MSVIIREAVEEDVLRIQHFISKAGVSSSFVLNDWQPFIVAEDNQRELIATAALQPVNDNETLIRSVIVDADKVNGSFVLKMLETAIQYAWQKDASVVYVMATQAGDMLEKIGFKKVREADLSKELKEVPEVATYLEKKDYLYGQAKKCG